MKPNIAEDDKEGETQEKIVTVVLRLCRQSIQIQIVRFIGLKKGNEIIFSTCSEKPNIQIIIKAELEE